MVFSARSSVAILLGGLVAVVVASSVVVVLDSNEAFFGAKRICDERQASEDFGHREWVRCFNEIRNRSLPERVALKAWPWLLAWAVIFLLFLVHRWRSGSLRAGKRNHV